MRRFWQYHGRIAKRRGSFVIKSPDFDSSIDLPRDRFITWDCWTMTGDRRDPRPGEYVLFVIDTLDGESEFHSAWPPKYRKAYDVAWDLAHSHDEYKRTCRIYLKRLRLVRLLLGRLEGPEEETPKKMKLLFGRQDYCGKDFLGRTWVWEYNQNIRLTANPRGLAIGIRDDLSGAQANQEFRSFYKDLARRTKAHGAQNERK